MSEDNPFKIPRLHPQEVIAQWQRDNPKEYALQLRKEKRVRIWRSIFGGCNPVEYKNSSRNHLMFMVSFVILVALFLQVQQSFNTGLIAILGSFLAMAGIAVNTFFMVGVDQAKYFKDGKELRAIRLRGYLRIAMAHLLVTAAGIFMLNTYIEHRNATYVDPRLVAIEQEYGYTNVGEIDGTATTQVTTKYGQEITVGIHREDGEIILFRDVEDLKQQTEDKN